MFRFSRGYCISFFPGLVFSCPSFPGPNECSEGAARIIRAHLPGIFIFVFLLSILFDYCSTAQLCIFHSTNWDSPFYLAYVIFPNRTTCVQFAYLWSNVYQIEPFLNYNTMQRERQSQHFIQCVVGCFTFVFEMGFYFLGSFCFQIKLKFWLQID